MSKKSRVNYDMNLRDLANTYEYQQKMRAAGTRKEDDKAILGKITALRMTSR